MTRKLLLVAAALVYILMLVDLANAQNTVPIIVREYSLHTGRQTYYDVARVYPLRIEQRMQRLTRTKALWMARRRTAGITGRLSRGGANHHSVLAQLGPGDGYFEGVGMGYDRRLPVCAPPDDSVLVGSSLATDGIRLYRVRIWRLPQ